jgi:hypothetical protein
MSPEPDMPATPDLDPAAERFVDDLLLRITRFDDRKIVRLALLMAYTAGYRDCQADDLAKNAAQLEELKRQCA